MAIKLPVRVVHDDHVVDVDGGFIALGDESYAAEIATALNAYPALVARVEELEGALEGIREFAQEQINDIAADIQEGGDRRLASELRMWSDVLAALSRKTGGET